MAKPGSGTYHFPSHSATKHLVKWLHFMIKKAGNGEKMAKGKKTRRMDSGGQPAVNMANLTER